MVKKDELETWTDEDSLPVEVTSSTQLDELSWNELEELGQIHILDVDERVQFEKDDLLGKPFMILGWHFTPGEYGDDSEFAVVTIRTQSNELGFITDGSTGIKEQLHRYEFKMQKMGLWEEFVAGNRGGIKVPSGLRKSNYIKKLDDGTQVPASTFYFDNRDR